MIISPLCGTNPEIKDLEELQVLCETQLSKVNKELEIEPEELKELQAKPEEMMLIDIREEYEREICCNIMNASVFI